METAHRGPQSPRSVSCGDSNRGGVPAAQPDCQIVIDRVTSTSYVDLVKMTISHDLLRLKLAVSLAATPPDLTRRDVRLPGIRGQAPAVIGVRRGGRTPFLPQGR